ncbi:MULTISPECIES: hypothetical protein [unclassified Pseudomonas]|uniref:hypothetical protein n=1 Tax=unclassified Pseudomonas TaxID=196821 RepID=UPI0013E35D88|nr:MULTISPECIES: hypothetical protein [unclassified Pseudomonas]UMZ13902.1 hypothetical protein I9018_09440 [Pseudomonas sp. MPFS]
MAQQTSEGAQPGDDDPQVINDPGNEDPGSLLDDARVPLQEETDAQDRQSDKRD